MTVSADLTATRFLTDRDGVVAGLLTAGADLAALLRSLPPEAAGTAVPGLDWTVAEVTAHVVTVVRRSLGDTRRSADPAGTAALNAACLDEFTDRDLTRLAGLLEQEIGVVTGKILPRFVDDDLPIAFHGGTTVRLLTGYGVMLADLLVHRWDVATATGRPVDLPAGPSRYGAQALLELLPVWVDPAHRGRVVVHLDLDGAVGYVCSLQDGLLEIVQGDPGDGSVPSTRMAAADLLLALCARRATGHPATDQLCSALLPI